MENEIPDTTHIYPSSNQYIHFYPVYETGQLRRAKMHVAHLTNSDNRKSLPPALLQLLETSIILKTTDSKMLARQLKRKQDAIHADLQEIHHFLVKKA